MNRVLLAFGGFLTMLYLAAGASSADDPKSKPNDSGKTSYIAVGPLVGQVTKVDDKSITIRVTGSKQVGSGKTARLQPVSQDHTMNFAPDIEVRGQFLPIKLDENGKKVKYTPQEIKEAKGNSSLPGYVVEFSQLKVGQAVIAQVVHRANENENLVRWVYITPQTQR